MSSTRFLRSEDHSRNDAPAIAVTPPWQERLSAQTRRNLSRSNYGAVTAVLSDRGAACRERPQRIGSGARFERSRVSETVRRGGVSAVADQDATLRRMRADAREGGGLCLRPSLTAIGPAAYGHRLHPRQDFPGLVGCVLRCRCLRRRGVGGTVGHGGRRYPVDPFQAEAAADRSGAAQGDPGDLVCLLL